MLSAEARTQYSIPGSRQQYRTSAPSSGLSADPIECRWLAQKVEGAPQHTCQTAHSGYDRKALWAASLQ